MRDARRLAGKSGPRAAHSGVSARNTRQHLARGPRRLSVYLWFPSEAPVRCTYHADREFRLHPSLWLPSEVASARNPRENLYLPAVNNYWTRTAPVALVYFSETKRDRNYGYAPRLLSPASQSNSQARVTGPIFGTVYDSLCHGVKTTHAFSKIYFPCRC